VSFRNFLNGDLKVQVKFYLYWSEDTFKHRSLNFLEKL